MGLRFFATFYFSYIIDVAKVNIASTAEDILCPPLILRCGERFDDKVQGFTRWQFLGWQRQRSAHSLDVRGEQIT